MIVAALVLCGWKTYTQNVIWSDNKTLFNNAVQSNILCLPCNESDTPANCKMISNSAHIEHFIGNDVGIQKYVDMGYQYCHGNTFFFSRRRIC